MAKEEMITKLESYIEGIKKLRNPLEENSKIYNFYTGMEAMIKDEIEKLKNTEEIDEEEIYVFNARLYTYIENEIKNNR